MFFMTVSIKMTVNDRPKSVYTETVRMPMTTDFEKAREIMNDVYDRFRDRNQHLRTVEMWAEASILLR